MTTCSFTGHRPNKLSYKGQSGYVDNPLTLWIREKIKEILIEIKPEKAISGMALGTDQISAQICIELGIPWIAAIPFIGQELAWPEESQQKYRSLLAQASEVHIVCDGGYAAWKMQHRNKWMCDNSDIVIGVYNGDRAGGTANCINYAKSKNKQIIIINPNNFNQ